MDADSIIQIIVLIILLLLSAFFSSAETALTTVNKIKIRTLAEAGNSRAKTVLAVVENPQKMLSAILIGNNIVNLSASSLATTIAVRFLGSYGAGIATGILTFIILIFGEISPKTAATIRSTRVSLRYARVIYASMVLLTPFIIFINALAGGFLKILGIHPSEEEEAITEEELKTIVDVSQENGIIESEEQKYIHNIFDFSDAVAKEIMIPRIDMTVASIDCNYQQLIEIFQEGLYTRIPIFDGESDNIVGLINMKDLLLVPDRDSFVLREHLRECHYTFEQKHIADLFEEMRQNSISLAIVVDEYGALSGMITLEDLLEELVGEIRDEFDDDEEDDIKQINDREYDVLGSTNLDDLCQQLPLGFESEDYDTLGGFLTGEFDHFPAVGETYLSENGTIIRVMETEKNRITKVHIKFPYEEEK